MADGNEARVDEGRAGDPWGGGGWDVWAPWFQGGGFPGPGWVKGNDQTEAQLAWFAQMLPYLQAYQQSYQWGTEFDWRQDMDRWQQESDRWSQAMQERMFNWEQDQGMWGREFQQEQLDWSREAETQRLEAEREAANLAAFGRRWKPSSRWV